MSCFQPTTSNRVSGITLENLALTIYDSDLRASNRQPAGQTRERHIYRLRLKESKDNELSSPHRRHEQREITGLNKLLGTATANIASET